MLFKKKSGYGALLALVLLLHVSSYGQVGDKLAVWFPFGGSTLSEEAKATIDDALSRYQHGKRIIGIRLSGYCDSIGSNAYNDRLSLLRVRAIRRYLHLKLHADTLKTDVAALFQSVRGYGKRRPVNDNADSAKRALNRRVEILLLVALSDAPPGNPGAAPGRLTAPPPDTAISSENPVKATASSPGREVTGSKEKATSVPLSEALLDTGSLAGRNIVLRNVNFYGDRHVPLPSAYSELEQLAKLLLARPALCIEIQGYVCCIPDNFDGYDADTHKAGLSTQRARFVYQYLINQGISASRMSYKGFGGSHKMYPEENDATERALNRRVEVKIVKIL